MRVSSRGVKGASRDKLSRGCLPTDGVWLGSTNTPQQRDSLCERLHCRLSAQPINQACNISPLSCKHATCKEGKLALSKFARTVCTAMPKEQHAPKVGNQATLGKSNAHQQRECWQVMLPSWQQCWSTQTNANRHATPIPTMQVACKGGKE